MRRTLESDLLVLSIFLSSLTLAKRKNNLEMNRHPRVVPAMEMTPNIRVTVLNRTPSLVVDRCRGANIRKIMQIVYKVMLTNFASLKFAGTLRVRKA